MTCQVDLLKSTGDSDGAEDHGGVRLDARS